MKTVVMTLAALLINLSLLAQERVNQEQEELPVSSFAELRDHLRIGDTVHVRDAERNELRGKISGFDWDRGSVTLRDVLQSNRDVRYRREVWRKVEARTLTEADVRRLEHEVSDPLTNGAAIGGAIGAGSFVLLAVGLEAGFSPEAALWGALFSAAGAGIGAASDAAFKRRIVLFEGGKKDLCSWSLGVAPIVTREAKGLALRLSF
jgi:hypothetical protein